MPRAETPWKLLLSFGNSLNVFLPHGPTSMQPGSNAATIRTDAIARRGRRIEISSW